MLFFWQIILFMLHTIIPWLQHRWLFIAAATLYALLTPREERLFGVWNPFHDSERRRPWLSRAIVFIIDGMDKRLFGRQKTGGWLGIVGMLGSVYRKGDFFAGRLSLFGRFGLLIPIGIRPVGQAVTFGMPGSGKSTGTAIPAVLLHNGPVICFDPKGEIAQRCFVARGRGGNGVKGRGDKTYCVDPVNLTKLPRSRYNPLHEIEREANPDNTLRLIFNLAEAMVKNPGGGENSWIYTGARDTAIGLIAYVLTTYPHELRNLLNVRRLLMEGDTAGYAAEKAAGTPGIERLTAFDVLLSRMTTVEDGPLRHVIAGQAATLTKMGEKQRGSVVTALVDATSWLDLPQFQDATSACDFYLRDFQSERISLFVCLPLNELTGVAGGFMRMFLVMFTDIMYRADAPPKAGTVLCLVDEFPQFGHIDRFCAIGPTMRSYGVKLWVLLQDIGQLKASYPTDWEGFIGCAAMVQYYAIKHGATVDYLVRSLGEKIIRERQPDGRITSRPYPLLDREQACRYLAASDGNVIVVRYDQRPLRLKTAPYFWFLPFWQYSPDPLYPEPWLRAWSRRRAVRRQQEAAVGKGVEAHAINR